MDVTPANGCMPCFVLLFVSGGEGAPPLTESLTNLGVNAGALVVLLFLLLRDLKEKEKATKITAREESLGRLLVRGGGGRGWSEGE